MIILFTSNNPASLNIAKKLIEMHGFEKCTEETDLSNGTWTHAWKLGDTLLIDTKAPTVLDVPTNFETDCLIVLSTHRSKNGGKMLTAHIPGNWDNAELGGEPRTLNIAAASILKIIIQEIKKEADKIGWSATLEADHHGPTCKVPIIFVEIGSSESEWTDKKAAEAIANAVVAVIAKQNTEHKTFETVFGVGGGHYPRAFTKLAVESDLAIGHMAPKYAIDAMDEEMFRQASEKNVEQISKVLVLKDETNMAQKEKIKALAARFGIVVEMI